MRKACVAGNWKMNKTVKESALLVQELLPDLEKIKEVESIICPPFTALHPVAGLLKDSTIKLGAQNLFWEEKGAYTGEISPAMVAEIAEYVILGHSERRAYFHDTDESVNKKVLAALTVGIKPILCVGETLEENESGQTGEVITRQLRAGLADVDPEQFESILIAYEPVWAIGTGKAATPEAANQIIADNIRTTLSEFTSQDLVESIRILYGGSVKPDNAKDFFQEPEIDGALVGGASLTSDAFVKITEAAI
jgi:triosephosphate isomerase